MYFLAPSELDYKAKKCKRCFYIHKKDKISSGNFPPPVFSSFDVCQTNYFKSKNCSIVFPFVEAPSMYIFLHLSFAAKINFLCFFFI